MTTDRSGVGCVDALLLAVSEEQLYLHGLPQEVLDTKWDVILVDGPTGRDEQQYVARHR